MRLTLRGRLAIVSALMFAVLLAGVGQVSYRLLARRLDADVTTRLTELTDGLRGCIRMNGDVPEVVYDHRDRQVAAFIHDATQYYQVVDGTTGRVLVQSEGMRALGDFTPDQIRTMHDRGRPVDLTTPRGRLRLSTGVLGNRPEHAHLLQVAVSLASIDAALRSYGELLLWSLPIALVVTAVVAWHLAGVALSPLFRVADVARGIDVRSLETRLPVRGTRDELDQLVTAFNDTLERLQHAVGEMRQFSAALAHELRTPLAILRGEIELSLRQSHADETAHQRFVNQLEAVDRLKRLIDQILTLARAESGQIPLTFAPVDLSEVADSIVEQLEPLAEAQRVELSCRVENRVVVEGDAGWLQRLLLNLLDNALKFTPAGGRIRVTVWRVATLARLSVEDTGTGMSAEDATRVFERFFRADTSRGSSTDGAGLGLSLARWIVERHHGTIAVDSRQGNGSTFTVTLPASPRRVA